MANKQINELTTTELPLDGTESFHAKVGANSRKVSFDELANFVGKGPLAQALGFAKFTRPGDIFTVENGGTPVANAYDAADSTWLIDHDADDNASFAAASVTLGADFDKVFTLRGSIVDDNDASLAIFCGNSSSGIKLVELYRFGRNIELQFWTNTSPNVLSVNITNERVGLFPSSVDKFYMRVTRVGTAITFYVSMDGLDWMQVSSGTTSSHSISDIDEVGFGVYSAGVGAGRTYLRCIGYDDGPQPEAMSGGGTMPVAFKGFRSTNSAAQSITAWVETEVTLGTELFDTEGAFASNKLTVPASLDGKYGIFNAGIKLDSNRDGACYIEVSTDGGSSWVKIAQGGFASQDGTVMSSGVYALLAGDIYRLTFALSGGNVADNDSTFFSMGVLESSEDTVDYVEDTGTSRTLTSADFNGRRTLEMNNAAAITLTLNTGLSTAGPLKVIAGGAGQITVSGTGTLESKSSATKSNGQNSSFDLVPTNTVDTYKMIGDITT